MGTISDSSFRALKPNEWIDLSSHYKDSKHYVTMGERPGIWLLQTAIEHYLFPPGTAANQNFDSNIVDWKEAAWVVFSTPKSSHEDVSRIAQTFAMRVCVNPPSVMLFGRSPMVITPPVTESEESIKAVLIRKGMPPRVANALTGLERFPGEAANTHAIETDRELLATPLDPRELPDIAKREKAMRDTISHGVRPPLKEVAEYVYGKGRVLASPEAH